MVSKQIETSDMGQSDRTADVKGILIVFVAVVLTAVYFASGWAPGT
jgi:hypothetical protein